MRSDFISRLLLPWGIDAAIAKRLTMEIDRMLRGEMAQTVTGFWRPLNYPPSGVA